MNTTATWRSALAVRAFLVAALAAAAFLGAYGLFSPTQQSGPGQSHGAGSAHSHAHGKGAPASGTQAAGDADERVASFISADAGACLTWDIASDGTVSNFTATPCEKPHRFEIASREDLATYPSSEFGPKAQRPDVIRQNALRDELCEAPTVEYLKGAWDPHGRFDVASILPPESSWRQGDRTLLCGLQTTDAAGVPQLTTGKVNQLDQAELAQPGQCRVLDEHSALRTVECSQPHHLEITSVVNAAEKFPQGYPAEADMDAFLSQTCTQAAMSYLGGEENLYQSTLQPFWGSLTREAWDAGTRSVNCSLVHPNNGALSEILGSATGGRDALTIDGAPPTPQPQRNPLRTDLPHPDVAGEPAAQ